MPPHAHSFACCIFCITLLWMLCRRCCLPRSYAPERTRELRRPNACQNGHGDNPSVSCAHANTKTLAGEFCYEHEDEHPSARESLSLVLPHTSAFGIVCAQTIFDEWGFRFVCRFTFPGPYPASAQSWQRRRKMPPFVHGSKLIHPGLYGFC